jgi:putative ABC transport system substrate-binding protein
MSTKAVTIAAASLALVALVAEAQQPAPRAARIGFPLTSSLESPEGRVLIEALRQGLRGRGYVEGQNIVVEYRGADGMFERLPTLATELARLNPDVIVATSTPVTRAVQQATTTIPIVATAMGDPVRDGFVASLAKPGGKHHGLDLPWPRAGSQAAGASRGSPTEARACGGSLASRRLQRADESGHAAAKRQRGADSRTAAADGRGERPRRSRSGVRHDEQGARRRVFVFPSSMLFNERRRIADLAMKHRLPAMTNAREFAELGCLIAYGASVTDLAHRSTTYVDKILKGARPGDLPVEQPSRFDLVINLKTASVLGVAIPQTLRLQAAGLIE